MRNADFTFKGGEVVTSEEPPAPLEYETATGRSDDLPRLLRLWQLNVEEVERGYENGVDDYTHNLHCRDLLEARLREAAPDPAEGMREAVDALDRRFRKATLPVDRPVGGTSRRKQWWWFRVPGRRGDEMDKDLRERRIEEVKATSFERDRKFREVFAVENGLSESATEAPARGGEGE